MHHHEVRANDASSRTGRWTRPPLIQEIRASMLEASTIGTGNSGIDAGRAHHRYRKFGHRYWTRPPSMQEIWASMVDAPTIDTGNSGIDAGHVHHRCWKFRDRSGTLRQSPPSKPRPRMGSPRIGSTYLLHFATSLDKGRARY